MVASQTTVLSDLIIRHLSEPEDDISPDWRYLLMVESDRGDQRDAHQTALWSLPCPLQPVVSSLSPADLDNYCLSGGLLLLMTERSRAAQVLGVQV